MAKEPAHTILLYDGVCGLCNRLVQFILKRDKRDCFRFSWLQSDFAVQVLGRHGAAPDSLDTMYAVLDYEQPGERLLARSDAVVFIMRELGGTWAALAAGFRLLPGGIRNWAYNVIARNRYRVFGKYEVCMIQEEKYRHKFLDAQ
jgi:predicted DCC family thiol-disulfide oxidoreductase YuxK